MALPKEQHIEIALLREVQAAGGKARPLDLYLKVAAHFPRITEEDLRVRLDSGHAMWSNRVQWVRQSLINKGELDGSVRGVWAITEKGRRRLEGHLEQPPETRRTDGTKKRKAQRKVDKATGRVNHDELARTLYDIGQAFGFDTVWKPKVNDLRPDRRAFKSKRKTLDVAWQIGNLAWVPIEVQVAGSVADLIYRFQQVHQWSLRLVVVTIPSHRDEIEEAVSEYPFRDKMVVLVADEVLMARRSLQKLLALREDIRVVNGGGQIGRHAVGDNEPHTLLQAEAWHPTPRTAWGVCLL